GQPFPRGLTADEYYKLLEQGAQLSKQGQAKAAEAAEAGESQPCAGHCCSGAGNTVEGEAELLAEAMAGGEAAFAASAMSRRSTADQLLVAKACAQKAREHAQAGSLPAGLDRWIDAPLEPEPIPWPTTMGLALRPWVAKAGCG